MRWITAWLACLALAAGEASPLPASTQKLVEDATATADKARQVYDQAVAKEQAKLVAALAKEQERETKKGNLDGAVAIKSLIGEVELGLLQRRAEGSGDLLGDAAQSKAQPAAGAPADLVTDCPITTGNVQAEGRPDSLAEFITRAVSLRIPREDHARYQFSVQNAGTVVVITGRGGRHAALWTELEKSGFHRLDGGGEDLVWYSANLRTGDRFSLANPEGRVPTQILAARIRPAR